MAWIVPLAYPRPRTSGWYRGRHAQTSSQVDAVVKRACRPLFAIAGGSIDTAGVAMTTSVVHVSRAIVRHPASSSVDGLRSIDRGAPDVAALRLEHRTYVATLAGLDVAVDELPPLEAFPDSVFVEDPALVFPGAAVILRPGAPSRLGEAAQLRPALEARFERVVALEGDGCAEGGDVLLTPDAVYIGLSSRTDVAGATALARVLASLGRRAVVVTPPAGVLHLKTACSLVDESTVLATRAMADAHLFPGLETIVVPEGDEAVANALCINGVVLIAEGFPRTEALLAARGYDVRALKLDEVMKLDAGLSCMSLRWAGIDA
jgi:dimethylargininase